MQTKLEHTLVNKSLGQRIQLEAAGYGQAPSQDPLEVPGYPVSWTSDITGDTNVKGPMCVCVYFLCVGPLSMSPLCSSVPQSLEGMKVDSHSHPLQVCTHTNRTVCNPTLGIRFQPLLDTHTHIPSLTIKHTHVDTQGPLSHNRPEKH